MMLPRAVPWLGLLVLFALAFVGSAPPVGIAHSIVAPSIALAGLPDTPLEPLALSRIGRYSSGLGATSSEIVAFDPASDRMFITNAVNATVTIVDISTPSAPTLVSTIDIAPTYGTGINSVDVYDGVVAVAVEPTPKTDPGKVVFFDANGIFINQVTVGVLPDMITYTPNGAYVLTANEGEPNSYGQPDSVDPEGSISVIAMPAGGPANLTTTTTLTANTADFTSYNAQMETLKAAGVRIFGPNASVAQDFEPEYIAIAPDSLTAYVTLQENNAMAVVDIATATVTDVRALGFKDHSLAGNGLDPSDKDGTGGSPTINIGTWPILGMYQPDSIAAFEIGGTTYLVTANEGDARDYTGLKEEVRIKTLSLDPAVFPNATVLKQDAQLGRLTVTNQNGNTDADAEYEALYVFGARSFSIWNASSGALVVDSGDDIEQRTATLTPTLFNANDGKPADFDTRSDNKGPEPEAIEIGEIAGRTYVFVGLERSGGGVMVYDATNPAAPTFVQYARPTDAPDDIAPEGIHFISCGDSPTGKPLLLVSNEYSGSVAIYEITVPLLPQAYLPFVSR
ncbi:choice-of-anchor I family protein [Candidatus Oscillochloris fontis]|uniref:choice-of-anchor I family protein n=1 Tax=Candidatus Oscillochloris fontis TaxID=2496868 RepID=UPI001930E3A0|nr:choice-of-anchor I family protein [Candidatus Oscillochloris fontis]